MLAQWLFNVYLDAALKSNNKLNKAIYDSDLIAFADDIFIVRKIKSETQDIIQAMDSLHQDWGLKLNKSKMVVYSQSNEVKGELSIEGV